MIAIIDYNAGNLRSVQRACRAVGMEATITADAQDVESAERVLFPGVGAAPSAMETLSRTGLGEALRVAYKKGTPILGICLGTQIVLSHSEEGDVDCLGLVEGRVIRFRIDDPMKKIPHMGWNGITVQQPHPLLEGVEEGDEFYFVHSFYPDGLAEENVYAVTDYDGSFCSGLGSGNLFATQFHLEKSGRFGLAMLERFANWDGTLPE